MKIFAIKDDTFEKGRTIGYFFYEPSRNQCHIELPENIDPWDCPFVLEHYARHKQWTLTEYHTRLFIAQRVVPSDRQNIGEILKVNHMDYYDEIQLFILADGRCAQDDCYIKSIREDQVPENIRRRSEYGMCEIKYLEQEYLVIFENGKTALFSPDTLKDFHPWLDHLLAYRDFLASAEITGNGTSIALDEQRQITSQQIYEHCQFLPVNFSTMANLFFHQIVTTQEAMEILDCTRQNISDLVRRERLKPMRRTDRQMFFYRKDVEHLL